jgi:hypothetical protein
MFKLLYIQSMRHWSSQSDYTIIEYRGTVPRKVVLSSDGVEIPRAERSMERRVPDPYQYKKQSGSSLKEAEGLIPVSGLVGEIEKIAQETQRQFLPETAVDMIVRRVAYSNLRDRADSVPVDVTKWPDPPHTRLANIALDDPKNVKRFVEMYGFSPGMLHDPDSVDEIKANPDMSFYYRQGPMTVRPETLKQAQEFLRRSWGKTEQAEALRNAFLWGSDDITFIKGKPRIVLYDIWEYITVLFLIDLSASRLRVCPNSRCSVLKYFVDERGNKKFCSVHCKNYHHVYQWLADQVNRDAWNAGRRKPRAKSKAAHGGKS